MFFSFLVLSVNILFRRYSRCWAGGYFQFAVREKAAWPSV